MKPRRTDQRRAIRRAIGEAARPLTAQEVLEAAQSYATGLGIATVYRNLKAMTDGGLLRPVELPGEPCRYERPDLEHHHHFHCAGCGRVFDIPGCPDGVDGLAPEGFTVDRHELNLYGRCRDCRRRRSTPAATPRSKPSNR